MATTAKDVAALRERTGAGMMDCKKALDETNGDVDKAVELLRSTGAAKADKRAGRQTKEGMIANYIHHNGKIAVLVELNCETDFVARTDDFQQLMANIIAEIEKAGDAASDAWLKDPNGPVYPLVAAAIGKLGENMAVPRFVRYAGQGYVGQYIHLGGKLGVQVEFSGVTPDVAAKDEFITMVKEIAMQIAAAGPTYAARSEVPADALDKEKAIYRAQMENSGKPANVIEKIVEGKLGSFYAQVVLTDQPSIRDPKMSVADVITATNKSLGAKIGVTRFARLKVGEAAA